MSEIQRHDSPVGYMDACGDGEYMKVSDLAPYVEARVKEAVERVRREEVGPLLVACSAIEDAVLAVRAAQEKEQRS